MCIVFVRHIRVAVVENNPTYLSFRRHPAQKKSSILVNAIIRYVSLALSPFNREMEPTAHHIYKDDRSNTRKTMSLATSPPPPPPAPNPTLVLFARGVIARLELWPALRIAVEQGWGGPDSLAKRRWLASELVDAFDPEPQDADYVALMLAQVLEDEFGASIEDGSVEAVAADVVALWGAGEDTVREWERKAEGARGKRVDVREVVDEGGEGEDEDEWEDEGDEDEDEAPQSLGGANDPPQRPSKGEPVVDEDGFTLVQKGRR